jgi:PAS domain S-box-containing protein
MIRDHPRFQRTAIIFISAIHLTDSDYLRGYEMGGVDYVPVPVVPELLRAKVRVFAELYRKTRQLEQLNRELENRVAERTAELEASAARLQESEAQLRLATDAAEIGLWDVDNVTDTLYWPPRVRAMFGISSDVPVSMADFYAALHPADRAATTAAFVAACDPQKRALYDVEYRAIGKEDGVVRWVAAKGRGLFDGDGRCVRVIGTAVDITERKQIEERQLLLAREVDHRARNALAVVQAIVRLTRASSQEGYIEAVEGRIHALAQAHTLLSESRWEGANVGTLVGEELAPYRSGDAGRVVIEGPAVILSPEKAQNLALALHELATNSAKYGALSVAKGTLAVSWRSDGSNLTLDWREADGPPVQPPTSQGFGTKILNASIKHQIGGNVVWDWRPSGLHCSVQVPISRDGDGPTHRGTQGDENLVQLRTNAMKRVLVVEDDAMIGMMMREILTEHGLFVIGPCCTVSEALAASAADFDCAVLDLNLGGNPVYPVAASLAGRGIPFAFVTGYGRESIEPDFAHVPVMQKPVTREALEAYLRDTLGLPIDREAATLNSGNSPGAASARRA